MCYLMYIPVYRTAVVDNYESTILDVADFAAFEVGMYCTCKVV